MSRSRIDELLSAELDQDLSSAEQKELQQLLETSDEAVKARRDLQSLDLLLRDMPEQLLPASLHQRIVASVRLPQAAPAQKRNWFSGLFVSPVARFSFAAAAGVLFSLFIFNAAGPDMAKAPGADMIGSMIPHNSGEAGEVLDQLRLSGTGLAAGAVLLRVDQQLILNIRVDAAQPVDVSVDFEDSGLRFESLVGGSESVDAVHADTQLLQLRGTGSGQVQILLGREQNTRAAESATIQLEFSGDGLMTERGQLSLAQ